MKRTLLLIFLLSLFAQCGHEVTAPAVGCDTLPVKYLAFQLFVTSSTEPVSDYQGLQPFISKERIEDFFNAVQTEVGDSKVPCRKTAVTIGPLALDFSDADITALINESFQLAIDYDIAVAFHIDDGMFWGNRKDLWQNPGNVEWTDWNGTPNNSRYVDWVSTRLAPMMCFNAPAVKAAVKEFMTAIAQAIKRNMDQLIILKKEYLYAGSVVGWETSLDRDRDTQKPSGFHALANLGYTSANPPTDPDQVRIQIVKDYIEWMTKPFSEAGLPMDKTYSHVVFLSHSYYDYAASINPDFAAQSFAAVNNFSVPSTAIGSFYRPGFSTYPQPPPATLFDEIYDTISAIGWSSSEGANIIVSNPPASSGYDSESYLARHFNHGCTLLNLFAFRLRGDNFTNAINDATEGNEALAAYKKFLRGEPLKE